MTRYRDKETGEVVSLVRVYPTKAVYTLRHSDGYEVPAPPTSEFRARLLAGEQQPQPGSE